MARRRNRPGWTDALDERGRFRPTATGPVGEQLAVQDGGPHGWIAICGELHSAGYRTVAGAQVAAESLALHPEEADDGTVPVW